MFKEVNFVKENFKVIAVDGSREEINRKKQIVKVAYIVMENFNIVEGKTRTFITSNNPSIMQKKEVEIGKEIYGKYKDYVLLLDGCLNGDFKEKVIALSKESIYEERGENLLVKIKRESKKLSYKNWIYVYQFSKAYNSFITSFASKVPAFRVDYANLNLQYVYSLLYYYSKNNVIYGYPLPLYLAHKACKIYDYQKEVAFSKEKVDVEEENYRRWIRNFRLKD